MQGHVLPPKQGGLSSNTVFVLGTCSREVVTGSGKVAMEKQCLEKQGCFTEQLVVEKSEISLVPAGLGTQLKGWQLSLDRADQGIRK